MSGILDAIGYIFPAASKKSYIGLAEYEGLFNMDEYLLKGSKVELKSKLIESEGLRNDVYYDTRGILTVGIGHKVIFSDKLKFGEKDSAAALQAAINQSNELTKSYRTIDFIVALAEVNYQLGIYWYTKFPTTYELLKSGKWQQAVQNLKNSAWAKQTPVRVENFVAAIERQYNTFG